MLCILDNRKYNQESKPALCFQRLVLGLLHWTIDGPEGGPMVFLCVQQSVWGGWWYCPFPVILLVESYLKDNVWYKPHAYAVD